MKPRDTALRSKRFEASEKARKVASIETMIFDFEQMAADLARQIAAEEERTGVKDAAHFAYSTFAKAAALRRTNLLTSVVDLRLKPFAPPRALLKSFRFRIHSNSSAVNCERSTRWLPSATKRSAMAISS